MGRFIGVDLHRNCFTTCLMAENGREYLSQYRLEEIDRFLRKLRETDEVAVEVTGNTRLFYDLVSPRVARVVVVPERVSGDTPVHQEDRQARREGTRVIFVEEPAAGGAYERQTTRGTG